MIERSETRFKYINLNIQKTQSNIRQHRDTSYILILQHTQKPNSSTQTPRIQNIETKATREWNRNVLERHFAVRGFDFLIRGVARDAEDLVGVSPELFLGTVVLLRLRAVPRHLAPPSNQTTSRACILFPLLRQNPRTRSQ